MGWLGVSILIASISFLCYKHPPSINLTWLRRARRHIQNATSREQRGGSATADTKPEESMPRLQVTKDEAPVTKAELDRKAMPPPPPPPTITTPRALTKSQIPKIPSFNLSDGGQDVETEVPSFPATTSVQRTRGGTHPTAPAFPALNSVQRASEGSRFPYEPQNGTPLSGLMVSPPPRAPLPNRGPGGSSLVPPPTHNAIPTKPRKKVLLTPGHSPLDWARLTSSNANLRGVPPSSPYLRVPPSLLKQFTGRKGKDAWTVLGGRVYNMTPYLPYHPGGELELLKAAGRDGTKLFGEIHPWVNWEGMLEGCLVGFAVEEGDVRASHLEEMD